jgi:hypothetical protein
MKRTAIIAGLAVLALGGPALAFGTIRHLGQNAEHERITRRALQCTPTSGPNCFGGKTLDELAGRTGTFGAIGFPDNPRSGLISETKAHCDSGDSLPVKGYPQSAAQARANLGSCRAWMTLNLDKAVAEAAGLLDAEGRIAPKEVKLPCRFGKDVAGAKCRVLQSFGTVLHASQDFYSHSNWTDKPRPSASGTLNPPGLGKSGPAPWISLRAASAFPAGLISGCYEGVPEAAFCKGRVKHEVLNKDAGTIDPVIGAGTSSRGEVNDNFKRAVEAAIADTSDKWALLRERLEGRYGPQKAARMICALSNDSPAKQCA